MASQDLLDTFKDMTLIELAEFIKLFEDTFEVSAVAPVADAAAPLAAGGEDNGDAGSDKVDVILTSGGDEKIAVIKEVRALTSLGLKQAKDLVEGAPQPVLASIFRGDRARGWPTAVSPV